jgi:hypothetical protein
MLYDSTPYCTQVYSRQRVNKGTYLTSSQTFADSKTLLNHEDIKRNASRIFVNLLRKMVKLNEKRLELMTQVTSLEDYKLASYYLRSKLRDQDKDRAGKNFPPVIVILKVSRECDLQLSARQTI